MNIKKVIFLAAVILNSSMGYSQQKKKKQNPPPVSVEGTSYITKDSKWIEKFILKGNVYNVYLKNQKPSEMMEQTEKDTLIDYLFVVEKMRFSIKEIQKYATVKGKIGREGFYKVKGDTLITTVNYYDPYHGGTLITRYVPDKQGWLKEISADMKGIDTDTLSDRYIKNEKMLSPYEPGKN